MGVDLRCTTRCSEPDRTNGLRIGLTGPKIRLPNEGGGVTRLKHFVRFASVRRSSARERQQPQQPSRTSASVVAVDARDSDRRPRLVPPSRAAGRRNQGRVAAANSLRFKFNSSFFEDMVRKLAIAGRRRTPGGLGLKTYVRKSATCPGIVGTGASTRPK
ncbi:unnamed protein product [Cuscuta campestris]|uniref:Uncharacterized protein n=1 Tax=Cuscuta campestris TaxID=132261 RepID=A0A484LQW6_9ASTE|nr:unnamed protein product [Cuscuta campestris]